MTDHSPVIETFFAKLGMGELDDSYFTSDFSAWTTSGGEMVPARYIGAGKLFPALFIGGLTFEVKTITQQEDRAAVEVRSHGTFKDGEAYENHYLFMFRLRDGKVASIAEHFDPRPVEDALKPRLMALMASQQSGS